MSSSRRKTSFVWQYFTEQEKNIAKCNVCNKDIQRIRSGTSSMQNHLSSQHNIEDPTKGKDQSSQITDTAHNVGPSLKRNFDGSRKITSFIVRQSLQEVLAECAAKDGFSVAGIANSSAIRGYVCQKGYEMPKSEQTIWEMILSFHRLKFNELKADINSKLTKDTRFSISLDEWTDLTSRRYLMINLHDSEGSYNLGLKAIPSGHCTSDVIHGLVISGLADVGLNLKKHIVASTSDGASVMAKYGRLAGVITQFCINHGIHLSVTEILYSKKEKQNGE